MNPSLSDTEYQALTQSLLARIEAQADRWLQDDVIDIDTHRTGGLLELSFPDGSKIIFSTNFVAPRSGNFDLYLVDANASMAGPDAVEQVTFQGTFDGFPIFHPNGKQLLWASNRYAAKTGETNLFVADFRW